MCVTGFECQGPLTTTYSTKVLSIAMCRNQHLQHHFLSPVGQEALALICWVLSFMCELWAMPNHLDVKFCASKEIRKCMKMRGSSWILMDVSSKTFALWRKSTWKYFIWGFTHHMYRLLSYTYGSHICFMLPSYSSGLGPIWVELQSLCCLAPDVSQACSVTNAISLKQILIQNLLHSRVFNVYI